MSCLICKSPFRKDIEKLLQEKVEYRAIFERYSTLLAYTSPFTSFRILVSRHKAHAPDLITEKKVQALDKLEGVDIDTIVTKLTALAGQKMAGMQPDKLKLSEVFAGQRILIELKKLKMQEDSMAVAMAKLFGPPVKIINGEEVIDNGDKPAEIAGVQPENPQQPVEVRGDNARTPVPSGTDQMGEAVQQTDQHPPSGEQVGEEPDRSSETRPSGDVQTQP